MEVVLIVILLYQKSDFVLFASSSIASHQSISTVNGNGKHIIPTTKKMLKDSLKSVEAFSGNKLVVLAAEWVHDCIEEKRVLGSIDNYGGHLIK